MGAFTVIWETMNAYIFLGSETLRKIPFGRPKI
jgi:hypothetical protein